MRLEKQRKVDTRGAGQGVATNGVRGKKERRRLVKGTNYRIDIMFWPIVVTSTGKVAPSIHWVQKPYRLDITLEKGRLLAYVQTDIPSKKVVSPEIPSNIQLLEIELNLKKQKWLAICIYNRPLQNNVYFFSDVTNFVDKYVKNYSNILFMGDFNL